MIWEIKLLNGHALLTILPLNKHKKRELSLREMEELLVKRGNTDHILLWMAHLVTWVLVPLTVPDWLFWLPYLTKWKLKLLLWESLFYVLCQVTLIVMCPGLKSSYNVRMNRFCKYHNLNTILEIFTTVKSMEIC